jgi:hypothetical protein
MTLESLPTPELRWWLTQSHLWLGLFTVNAFVPCHQFFCLPRSVVSVCTPRSLGFLSRASNHWPCGSKYMFHLISQSLHSFVQVATQNYAASTGKNAPFMSTSLGLFIYLRDLKVCWPTSDNKQWTAEDSGLPGLKAPGFNPGH